MFAEGSRHEQEIVVTGDEGKIEAFVPEGTVVVGRRSDGREVCTVETRLDPRVGHEGFHHGASFLELLDFADAVRTGAPARVDTDAGRWSVATGIAAHRSIDEGRPVWLHELGFEPASRIAPGDLFV